MYTMYPISQTNVTCIAPIPLSLHDLRTTLTGLPLYGVGRVCVVLVLMQYHKKMLFFFQASFKTPWFAAGEGCNMTFFYHMNDRSNKMEMGSLAVEVKTVDQTWFMVFRKAGDQGDIWHQGTIDLSVRHLSLHHYNIFF